MSKQIYELYEKGKGIELTRYMQNINKINNIRDCVAATQYNDNIYKTVASFEDANIVDATEVPIGSNKEKMNFLLAQAIEQVTPAIHENMQLAGAAAKRWNDTVVIDSLQEKLNVAIDKLKATVKDTPIPSYSEMDDGQRKRVQHIFQTALKTEEPLSIDFITDNIDRYNAGASKGVLFKSLGLKLDYNNSIAVYEQDTYDLLLDEHTFVYLNERWQSYQNMVNAIAEHKYMTPKQLGEIVDTARHGKAAKMDSAISAALDTVDFDKAMIEYKDNSKETTEYNDIKNYVSGVNVIKPLSTNSINRLKGLCTIISQLQEAKVYRVDESKTDLTSDEIYHSLSIYFEVMEEVTQNLMVFLFLTQTTMRNNTVINDVIGTIDVVDIVINGIFDSIKNATGEDGVVSQEGIVDIIKKLTGRKAVAKYNPNVTTIEIMNTVTNIANRYITSSDTLFRTKLKDNNSLTDKNIKGFKDRHKAKVKELFNVDISGYDVEELFTFMTNKIFNTPLSHDVIAPLTCNLFDSRNKMAVNTLEFLENDDALTRMFHTPLTNKMYGFFDCFEVLWDEVCKMNDYSKPGVTPLEMSDGIIPVLDFFLDSATYFNRTSVDYQELLPKAELKRVDAVSFTSPVTSKAYTVGYQPISSGSLDELFELFMPQVKNKMTLNLIKNNSDIFTVCKKELDYTKLNMTATEYESDATVGYAFLKSLTEGMSEYIVNIKDALKTQDSGLDYAHSIEYSKVVDYIHDDAKAALMDIESRKNLINLVSIQSACASHALRDLYNNVYEIAEDFINLSK